MVSGSGCLSKVEHSDRREIGIVLRPGNMIVVSRCTITFRI